MRCQLMRPRAAAPVSTRGVVGSPLPWLAATFVQVLPVHSLLTAAIGERMLSYCMPLPPTTVPEEVPVVVVPALVVVVLVQDGDEATPSVTVVTQVVVVVLVLPSA